MTHLHFGQRLRTGLGTFLTGALLASAAFAQGPGGPPPFGGPPPGGGPPPISLVTLPLSVLDAALKLSASQDAQIAPIQQQFRPPSGGPPPPGEPGGPPPNASANAQIRALLTADQKQALPALLAKMNALGAAGIPPPMYPKLQLTADQQKQLVALGQSAIQARKQAMADGPPPPDGSGPDPRQQTHDKAMALLTGGQRLIIQQFLASHPPPGPGTGPGGGNGGFGPPPPGQDGPAPPDGFGPPPPDGSGPPPDGGPPPPGMDGPG